MSTYNVGSLDECICLQFFFFQNPVVIQFTILIATPSNLFRTIPLPFAPLDRSVRCLFLSWFHRRRIWMITWSADTFLRLLLPCFNYACGVFCSRFPSSVIVPRTGRLLPTGLGWQRLTSGTFSWRYPLSWACSLFFISRGLVVSLHLMVFGCDLSFSLFSLFVRRSPSYQ